MVDFCTQIMFQATVIESSVGRLARHPFDVNVLLRGGQQRFELGWCVIFLFPPGSWLSFCLCLWNIPALSNKQPLKALLPEALSINCILWVKAGNDFKEAFVTSPIDITSSWFVGTALICKLERNQPCHLLLASIWEKVLDQVFDPGRSFPGLVLASLCFHNLSHRIIPRPCSENLANGVNWEPQSLLDCIGHQILRFCISDDHTSTSLWTWHHAWRQRFWTHRFPCSIILQREVVHHDRPSFRFVKGEVHLSGQNHWSCNPEKTQRNLDKPLHFLQNSMYSVPHWKCPSLSPTHCWTRQAPWAA